MARQALSPEQVSGVRNIRDVTPYPIYDTIMVGAGARAIDPGWYNTFQEFAGSNALSLFAGRQGSVGDAWTNMRDPRRDWAMDIRMMHIEVFTTAPALGTYTSSPHDSQFLPNMWCKNMPEATTFKLGLGDQADQMLLMPLSHAPAGYGSSGGQMDGSAAPSLNQIVNGQPHVSNFFAWPQNSKLEIPAKSKIDVKLDISDPIRSLMTNAAFPTPGNVIITNGELQAQIAIWYGIRVTLMALRAVQVRGAYSA